MDVEARLRKGYRMPDGLPERLTRVEVEVMELRRQLDAHLLDCAAQRRETRQAIERLRETIYRWAGIFIAVVFVLQIIASSVIPIILHKILQ